MRAIIKCLKHKKFPGHDRVTNRTIKQLPCHCIHYLTAIYNSGLKLQRFPLSWKKEQVITIPKPWKEPKFPQSLRPISLFSSLGQIYNWVLLIRLVQFLVERKLVPEEEFGVMAGFSTTQLLGLESTTEGFQTKQTTVAIFLDISKAYDTSWHTGLIYKLTEMRLPVDSIKIIPKPETVQSQDWWRTYRVETVKSRSPARCSFVANNIICISQTYL